MCFSKNDRIVGNRFGSIGFVDVKVDDQVDPG